MALKGINHAHARVKWFVLVVITIIAGSFLVYSSTFGHAFIHNWDDYDYIVRNQFIRGFSPENLAAVFSKNFVSNYAPLHLISYMIDYKLWGLDPAGYHGTNVFIHALNGILMYRLLVKLELSETASLFGAALFVLHPVQVESVAWVSERKNVLSAFFFLLSLLTYIDYRQATTSSIKSYLLSMIFFACALLTKSAAVILPLVIISYDYCFCVKTRPVKLVDKIPFLLLALAAGVLAIISHSADVGGGRMGFPGGTPLTTLWTMMPVFISYLKDLIYPFDLSPYYIVPIRFSIDSVVIFSMLILLVCAGIAYRAFKHNPRLFFFISVYVFSLLPVIQIIPLLTLKNDRYLYFPMIGVVGIAALLLSSLQVRPGRFQGAVMVTAVAICLFFGGVTYSQAQKWSDTRTLWQFAIRQDPNNMLAWLMLTKAYTEMGKTQEAMSALKTYLELKSKFGPLRGWEGIGA